MTNYLQTLDSSILPEVFTLIGLYFKELCKKTEVSAFPNTKEMQKCIFS